MVTFHTKIQSHCTPHAPFSKNTYCIKLHFDFDCFSPIFASPTEKSFPRLCTDLWSILRGLVHFKRRGGRVWGGGLPYPLPRPIWGSVPPVGLRLTVLFCGAMKHVLGRKNVWDRQLRINQSNIMAGGGVVSQNIREAPGSSISGLHKVGATAYN